MPDSHSMTPSDRPLVFAATLALAMAVSTFLMVVFGTLAPFFAADLGLSRTQVGTLTTALYVTGALLSPVLGPAADRLGARRLVLALFAVGAASFVAAALAPSYALLLVVALFGGLAVAIGNPATNLLIATHTQPDRQGVVTGVKQSGVQIGVFLGGAALPALAAAFGWRTATMAAVVLPALGVAGLARAVPQDGRPAPRAARVGSPRLPVGMRWLAAYGFGMGLGVSAVGAYLPLYAVERLGMAETVAGLLSATIGAVGIAARILWGRSADRSTTPPARSLTVLGVASVVAAALVLLAEPVSPALAWAGAVVAGGSAVAWTAVGMLAVVRQSPLAVAGRASGLVLLGFYGGFIVGPPAFGVLVDTTGRYASGWLFTLAAFAVSTAVGWAWGRSEANS